MWGTTARVLVVFTLWGVALLTLLRAEVSPGAAEPLAAGGAGLSLLTWGALAARRSRKGEAQTSGAELAERRRRASV